MHLDQFHDEESKNKFKLSINLRFGLPILTSICHIWLSTEKMGSNSTSSNVIVELKSSKNTSRLILGWGILK